MTAFTCSRCGTAFGHDDVHTELVRRDFDGRPQPSKIRHLCADCLAAFEGFMGEG